MNPFFQEMIKVAGVDDGHDTYKATRMGGWISGGLGTAVGAALGGRAGHLLSNRLTEESQMEIVRRSNLFRGSLAKYAPKLEQAVARDLTYRSSPVAVVGGAALGAAVLGVPSMLSGRGIGAGVDMLRHPDGASSPDFRPIRQGAVAGAVLAPLAAFATHRPGTAGAVDRALGSVYGGALTGAGIGTLAVDTSHHKR